MGQFNIKDMPERAAEQLQDLHDWSGYTKTQAVLIAIERLWLEVKRERVSQMNVSREQMLDEICDDLLISSSSITEEEKESDRSANRAIYSRYSDKDLSETYRRLKNQIEMGR